MFIIGSKNWDILNIIQRRFDLKTEEIKCKQCKNKFTVYVKKKQKMIDAIKNGRRSIPNCKQHGGKIETKAD